MLKVDQLSNHLVLLYIHISIAGQLSLAYPYRQNAVLFNQLLQIFCKFGPYSQPRVFGRLVLKSNKLMKLKLSQTACSQTCSSSPDVLLRSRQFYFQLCCFHLFSWCDKLMALAAFTQQTEQEMYLLECQTDSLKLD